MKTEILYTDTREQCEQSLDRAAEILRSGGLVAIPTETVYGLAANAMNPQAVQGIYRAKGRPSDNPLIVHISSGEMLDMLITELDSRAKALMQSFWPGPLTIILPRSSAVPDAVTGGLDTVALRMPSHPLAIKVIERAGVPIAAPSANISGSPSPTKLAHCIADLSGRVDAILDGGDCEVGVESTVISMVGQTPRILRPGAITLEQMQAVIGEIEMDPAVTAQLESGIVPTSPGMKYKHYSPRAQVFLLEGSLEKFVQYLGALGDGLGVYAMVFDGEKNKVSIPSLEYGAEQDHDAQAQNLFETLRRFDELGAQRVYVRCPNQDGVGLAVYNRLIRAAGFNIVRL